MSVTELYQRLIVEHSRHPRNAKLPEAARVAEGFNRLCGDRVTVGVVVDAGVIAEIGCVAKACAICVAAASIMSEAVAGAPVTTAWELADRFQAYVDGEEETLDNTDLDAFVGVRSFPSRKKCATLPWETLRDALPARK